jgi:hypothetical protein
MDQGMSLPRLTLSHCTGPQGNVNSPTLAQLNAPELILLTADTSHELFLRDPPHHPIPANQQHRNSVTSLPQLSESRALEGPDDTLRYPGRDENMSDIQQYLLDFDRNKKEATATAQRSATRMYEVPVGHLVG